MDPSPIFVDQNEECCTTTHFQVFGGDVFGIIHHSVFREFLHEFCDTLRQVI